MHAHRSHRRRLRRAAAAGALAIAGVLAAAPTAAADPYAVDFCKVWGPASSDRPAAVLPGLSVYGPNAIIDNSCGAGGAGGAIHLTVAGSAIGFTQSVGLRLAVPDDRPNVTIANLWTAYRLKAKSAGSDSFLELYAGDQRIGTAIAPAQSSENRALPAGTRVLRWNVFCSTNASTNCYWGEVGIFDLFKSRLFLDEPVDPELTITGGTLLAAGPRTGAQTVAFDASDADSGLARVTVSLGATVVAEATYPCAFDDWSACRRDRNGSSLTVDTTKVADGPHIVTVAARDAAGNLATRSRDTVVVANGGAVRAPEGADGPSPAREARLSVRFSGTSARTRRLRFGASPAITGTLTGTAGAPIGGAAVAVLARNANPGAKRRQIAIVQTQADGAFAYRLPGGPSRTVTFSYTAPGDATASARASLRTEVAASLSARASARSVRAGHSFTIEGRLRHLRRAGVKIIIQARGRRGWETILHPVRTRTGGRYVWRTRFGRETSGRTYTLRARVDSETYPFSPGSSHPLRISVER